MSCLVACKPIQVMRELMKIWGTEKAVSNQCLNLEKLQYIASH